METPLSRKNWMTIPLESNPFDIYSLISEFSPPPKAILDGLADTIPGIIEKNLPGRKAARILDRGEWGRRIFEVVLDSDEVVMVKFRLYEDWLYGPHKSRAIYGLLHPRGLCATEEIAADDTLALAPLAFVIEKKARGVRLDRLLKSTPQEEWSAIYQAIGRHYRMLHAITAPHAGYWIDDPGQPFDVHPNEFYLQNDIGGENGSGYKLVKMGYLTLPTLERVIDTWRNHLEELKNHPVGLVHGTAAPWTIYLSKESSSGEYRVSRMGADDLLWWDPAYDLTMLRWPPLSDTRPEDWQALVEAYGSLPYERRLLLYRLMQSLLTACWAYMGPRTPDSDRWLASFRQMLDKNLNEWVDRVESA
jgi:hypothetical protein